MGTLGEMLSLTPNECRVLGVLVEKAHTTPQQYPLTLNAMTSGCNQKNNREPVMNLSEEEVLTALDGLRTKGLAREVMLSGSRVEKFRHVAREVLDIDTNQLVILTELLLRGPQTVGELRGRASRMATLETTEIVKNILDSLISREAAASGGGGPLVQELPPASGDRSPRYAQLLCPDLHPLDAPVHTTAASQSAHGKSNDLEQRVHRLECEVGRLRETVNRLTQALGEPAATKAD